MRRDEQTPTDPVNDASSTVEDLAGISRLTALAESLGSNGSDGLAGMQCIVRAMEELEPGTAERFRVRLAQRRIARGLPTFAAR